MRRKNRSKFVEGKGITQIYTVPDQQKLERYKNIEYYKDILYQCGKCGTCRTGYQENGWPRVCPSGEFGKFEAYYLGGKNLLSWAVSSGKLNWTENLANIFYQCSVCMACIQQCQIPEIHHFAGEWLMAMREEAVQRGFGPMPEQKRYTEHVIKEYNPYMEMHKERTNWISSNIKQNSNAKLAYFVGCTTSYREKSIALATAEILNSLGIEFRILKDEHCCGSPVYMTGQTDLARKIAESNITTFKKKFYEGVG